MKLLIRLFTIFSEISSFVILFYFWYISAKVLFMMHSIIKHLIPPGSLQFSANIYLNGKRKQANFIKLPVHLLKVVKMLQLIVTWKIISGRMKNQWIYRPLVQIMIYQHMQKFMKTSIRYATIIKTINKWTHSFWIKE
jgi:hypothetical protein